MFLSVLNAKIAADMNALKANVVHAKHDRDVDCGVLTRLATNLRLTPHSTRTPDQVKHDPRAGFGLGTIWLRASRTKLLDASLMLQPEVRRTTGRGTGRLIIPTCGHKVV